MNAKNKTSRNNEKHQRLVLCALFCLIYPAHFKYCETKFRRSVAWGSDVCAGWAAPIVEMVACSRKSSTASSKTRLAELAKPNCAIKTSSSMTWRASASLHSPGKHLLTIATDGVPLWVTVIHCQPQATQKNWRSADLVVVNDGMGHDVAQID